MASDEIEEKLESILKELVGCAEDMQMSHGFMETDMRALLRDFGAFVARKQRLSDIDQIADQIVGVVRWPLVISEEKDTSA